MRDGARTKAGAEWGAYWPLPLAATLGATSGSLQMYSLGPFIQPLQNDFHWTRAEVSSGVTIAVVAAALFNPAAGIMLDHFGPRRMVLVGIPTITGALALLGTATGSFANWTLLWVLVALGGLMVQPMVWVAAVASRFDAGRGVATGLALCGPSLGISVYPLLGTLLIAKVGWRLGFVLFGAFWAVVLMPFVFLFFRGAADDHNAPQIARHATADILRGFEATEGLRSLALYQLMLAGLVLTFTLVGITVHLVPILIDHGLTPIGAAAIAGLLGIFSVLGKLTVGVLLDHWATSRVAIVICLTPIIGCGLFIAHGGWWFAAAAVAAIGLAQGAEFQLLTYLAPKHLGLKRFGLFFGLIMVPMALGTAIGPLVAAWTHDRFGSYDPFFWSAMPILAVAGLSLTFFGPVPDFDSIGASPAQAVSSPVGPNIEPSLQLGSSSAADSLDPFTAGGSLE